MTRILLAPDKFKGTFSANEIALLISDAIKKYSKEFSIKICPLADGGEGTAQLLAQAEHAEKHICKVHDPLFRVIHSEYYYCSATKTAFIESAAACGLSLLSKSEYNPCEASTFGVGELILDALKRSATHIVLTIGGTATTDAGIGMADALGFVFLDSEDKKLEAVSKNLRQISTIIPPSQNAFKNTRFTVLCDVDNPLFGQTGAAYIYAKQKGASTGQISRLDEGLRHFNSCIKQQLKVDFSDMKFAGAGGGLAAGAVAFLSAELVQGTNYIFTKLNVESEIRQADMIITGEGKLDSQTLNGKLVKHVCYLAKKSQKRVIIICGISELSNSDKSELSAEIYPLFKQVANLKTAKELSKKYLQKSINEIFT